MATHPNREASAVRIAGRLRRRSGDQALPDAVETRLRAERTRDFATADLYSAVCTIIGDRDGVFSRSQLPVAIRLKRPD